MSIKGTYTLCKISIKEQLGAATPGVNASDVAGMFYFVFLC